MFVPEKPFTAIGPIYFEYGALVITFNTAKVSAFLRNRNSSLRLLDGRRLLQAATTAVQKMQGQKYEDKTLTVLCVPNVQVSTVALEACIGARA